MYIRECIVSKFGVSCVERLDILNGLMSFVLLRCMESIVRDACANITLKQMQDSLPDIVFS